MCDFVYFGLKKKPRGQKTGDTLNSGLCVSLLNFHPLDFMRRKMLSAALFAFIPVCRLHCQAAECGAFLRWGFCCDFHLEAEGLPPATPPSKPTLNCSKQEGGDRCFLTCQSQVHISSGELVGSYNAGITFSSAPSLPPRLGLQLLLLICLSGTKGRCGYQEIGPKQTVLQLMQISVYTN